MKNFLSILFLATATVFTACSNNNTSKASNKNNTDTITQTSTTNSGSQHSGAMNDVISSYLKLKDALANDNGNDASSAAKQMHEAFAKVEASMFTADQKRIYDEVKDDIKEHTEHIGGNASNIEHQREHFDLLSQDVIDLVKATGSSKTLYKEFCPMYNNKKGASWLSESKEIKNPYYGSKMPECGEVKEEIKAKG